MMQNAKADTGEREVADVLERYSAAISAKDADAVVKFYTRDVVAYDLAPPLRVPTAQVLDPAYIQQWFDTWEGPIGSTGHELEIVVGDGVAYSVGLRRMTGTKKDGEHVELWFRTTACLRREAGGWKITHVHNSVPFAMDGSDRALLDLTPE